ncbi:serine hydrolase domain-containing protein [Spirosoma arcticum]
MNRILLSTCLLLLVVLSCKKEVDPKSAQKDLLTFSFQPTANLALPMAVDAMVANNQVTLTLPPRTAVNALKATFTISSLATVTVNGVTQESGVTVNDFTNPLTYRIVAEDGSSTDYKVSVSATKSGDAQLVSFVFTKAANPGLTNDVTVPINAAQSSQYYLVTLPTGTNVAGLKPTFTLSPGATVAVNGAAQTAGVSTNNFTKPIVYRITAEDGSAKEYTIEGSAQVDIATVENAVKAFMAKYNVPGMSVAITKDERLVYAKGYGLADKDQNVPVTNNSLFRIASVSKPITSIAAMKLVDEGKLNLDQKVFGAGSILGTTYGKQSYTPQLEQITVRQVLNHTAGGDAWNHQWDPANNRIDPFYQKEWLSYSQAQVISAVLDTRPVTQTPGTKTVYSNISTNIAGRIIEKVAGVSYEKYVQDNLLKPIGIAPATMRIGGSTVAERMPNEVVYYNPYPGYDQPYDFPIPRLDAHGGWITTSVNLARLLTHVDGFSAKKDILSNKARVDMITPTAVSVPAGGYGGYGLGWSASTNGLAYYHSGGMAGTASYWMRIYGYTFAILINTRSQATDYYTAIDRLCYDMTANLNMTGAMKGDQFDVLF